jgi:tRNA threonylcarbamoyladenosine biosynthesis protein TsaB
LPVLAVDTLLAVAEEARHIAASSHPHPSGPLWITAVLDARMGEVYVATYRFDDASVPQAVVVVEPHLLAPEHLADVSADLPPQAPHLWAGNAWDDAALKARWPLFVWAKQPPVTAWPTAGALLRLAPALWRAGAAVTAAEAQPLYIRNKVAQTTAERAAAAIVSSAS